MLAKVVIAEIEPLQDLIVFHYVQGYRKGEACELN